MRATIGLAIAGTLFAAPAQAMSVQEALTKGEALRAKGMLALFSPDLGAIKAEMSAAGKAWRAQIPTATPPVCAPTPVNLTDKDFEAIFTAVPPAERATTDARAAFIRAMNARYRCR